MVSLSTTLGALLAFSATLSVFGLPTVSIKLDDRSSSSLSGPSGASLTISLSYNATNTTSYYVPLDGISYSRQLSVSASNLGSEPFGLATVINAEGTGDITGVTIHNILQGYAEVDDVFEEAFASALFIQSNAGSFTQFPSSNLEPLVSTFALRTIFSDSVDIPSEAGVQFAAVAPSTSKIPIGPYAYQINASEGTVTFFPIYRLYPDSQEAFLYGVTPAADGSFVRSSGAVEGDYTSIPVPSRLYSANSTLPLAGMRIAVKDIFDVAGLKTGCGSRAHFALYPPRTQTSPAVSRLISLGAIVVGKTKSSQFANGERATTDWVDQLCPFNPRGDGYQDPSGSSSGSGAAMATYQWLDYAIGSDTGGSIRGPAGRQGLFGIRPSWGAITLQDVMPLSDVMDTGGYFARDAASFLTFGKSWYGTQFSSSYTSLPKRLLIPNDTWPVANNLSQPIFSTFIDNLQNFLGATPDYTPLSGFWNQTSGVNETLSVYMNQTYATLIGGYQYTYFGAPFIADYQAANEGRMPFIDPAPRTRWAFAAARGPGAYAEEEIRKEVFTNWTAEYVFRDDEASCSDSILVYPQSTGTTAYRDRYFGAPTAPLGFSYGRIGPFAGVPDVVVPLGQAPYNSTITGQVEYLPVTISLVTRKGCDYMVLGLINELANAGIIGSVAVGRKPFVV
ncbi:hypothetical protein JAAARDRAFT_165877 [Jaapia argillacea MUCL 33604]|uniref:Uncharacterized protein n=1 Tax=Jaapia argillacea MUCL 33604 TaxID=933084 RepID=A0A067QCR1_9AGAM|nr:hypothetical protein JAAARDRAFT_165877 [Jaapia argillacea MUCL 33604]